MKTQYSTLTFLALILIPFLLMNSDSAMAENQTAGELVIEKKIQYLLYLPDNYESKEHWPMILFLHGAGERGHDLEKVKKHGPPKLIASGKSFPFIVVSPQCPTGRWWSADILMDLLDDIEQRYKVDAQRVYLTGLSMGGYGSWDLIGRDALRFAAVAPICGGGNPSRARRMTDLPIWVFHGARDQVVPISQSEDMVSAIKNAGGTKVRFTVYPEAGHDSWTETYNNPEIYSWFLDHPRQETPSREDGTK